MQQNTMKQKRRKKFIWQDVLNPNAFQSSLCAL